MFNNDVSSVKNRLEHPERTGWSIVNRDSGYMDYDIPQPPD